MKYKDKLFCIFVFLHLFIFGSGILGAVLALSACFISLEYPLKYRHTYFWLLIIIYAVLLCFGFFLGAVLVLTNYPVSTGPNSYDIIAIDIAIILTLYYRDNDDFVFKEKVKKMIKEKSSDIDNCNDPCFRGDKKVRR